MTKNDWIINLENVAKKANEIYGFDVATTVFKKYGADNVYSLYSCYYDSVFSELEAMSLDD